MGRTRVFFRAGQISTLQKILNETSADKAPWIFGRLQEALENRRQAKAAAEEAQVKCQKPFESWLTFYAGDGWNGSFMIFCRGQALNDTSMPYNTLMILRSIKINCKITHPP